jgi:hypothetical protein
MAVLEEAIGEGGLKATATGNLPLSLVRAVGEAEREKCEFWDKPHTELDVADLHVARLVASLAGFVRRVKGKFTLTKKYQALRAKGGLAAAYPALFRAIATRYNWAYLDMYDDLRIIQVSFLFTGYLLQRHGDEWRPTAFYEDAFLTAFPSALNEVMPRPYLPPDKQVREAYSARSLHRFAVFMGLAERRRVGDRMSFEHEIRKLPLADEAMRFSL